MTRGYRRRKHVGAAVTPRKFGRVIRGHGKCKDSRDLRGDPRLTPHDHQLRRLESRVLSLARPCSNATPAGGHFLRRTTERGLVLAVVSAPTLCLGRNGHHARDSAARIADRHRSAAQIGL